MSTRRAEALLLRIDGDLGQLNRALAKAEGRTVQSGRRMQPALGKVDLPVAAHADRNGGAGEAAK